MIHALLERSHHEKRYSKINSYSIPQFTPLLLPPNHDNGRWIEINQPFLQYVKSKPFLLLNRRSRKSPLPSRFHQLYQKDTYNSLHPLLCKKLSASAVLCAIRFEVVDIILKQSCESSRMGFTPGGLRNKIRIYSYSSICTAYRNPDSMDATTPVNII